MENKLTKEFYLGLGISEKDILAINKEMALPVDVKLSPFARSRRVEMTAEAIGWPKGKSQEKRKITEIYNADDFVVAIGKPGKEASPDFKRKHYITGVVTNNRNVTLPPNFIHHPCT